MNAGQLAQMESLAVGMQDLVGMSPEVLDFYFAHLYIDLLGVRAGATPKQAFVISPVINSYMLVHDVARKVASGEPLELAYYTIVQHHAKRLNCRWEQPTLTWPPLNSRHFPARIVLRMPLS